MERLIQLLDDLDDLLAPALAFPTSGQWLRGLAVAALMVLVERAGASWPLAAMLALPALPVAQLAHARVRRLVSDGFQLPTLVGSEIEL